MTGNAKRASTDVWEAGEAYGSFMGRWSRLVAREFVRWLSMAKDRSWLDVGCGTGILTRTILELASPSAVRGVDQSAGFISFAREHIADPRASFVTGSAHALPSPSHAFDAVVSGLMVNFVTPAESAVAEMRRTARPGGVVAAYVWDYAGGMEFLRRFWDAAVALDPLAEAHDEGRRFPVCHPDRLRDLFAGQGLEDIEVRPIDVETRFVDFEDYWTPFLSGQGPAPGYVASLEPERQALLRERLRAALPGPGTIRLTARAWAVRGSS